MTPFNSTLVRVALYFPALCPKNSPRVPHQSILPEVGTVKHTLNTEFLPLLERKTAAYCHSPPPRVPTL